MRSYYITLFFLLISLSSFGQLNFEKGYYIDNSGARISGFIKNENWKNNPVAFEFKKTLESQETKLMKLAQVAAFGIDGKSTYEKHLVNVNRSTTDLSKLEVDRTPNMKIERLFLKVLISGENKLYFFRDGKFINMYYRKGEGELNNLVFKRYLNEQGGVSKNNFYQQQLFTDFKCENGGMPDISRIDYTKSDIVKYITAYNNCAGIENTIEGQTERQTFLNFKLRGGVNLHKFAITDNGNKQNIDFGAKSNAIFGFETELILPQGNGKWSAFLDARFLKYSGNANRSFQSTLGNTVFQETVDLEYRAFEVSAGLRYHFLLSNHSKLYLGLGYGIEMSNTVTADYELSKDLEGNRSLGSLGLSIGYIYNNISLEARYNTVKDHFSKISTLRNSEYSSFMLTFAYKFIQF